MTSEQRRFERQFALLARLVPPLRGVIALLLRDRWRLARLPLAVLLILGGVFSFLPLLGIWMLPLGLLLLAVDIPALRGPVSAGIVRVRRRVERIAAWWKRRRRSGGSG